jgi:hypothetical protein
MLRNMFLAAATGAALAGPALADDLPKVKSIEVETTLDDLNNPQAAAYWKSLDADMETAIAAQLVDRLGDEGLEINVDMDEVELANFFEEQVGAGENKLAGRVKVKDVTDNSNYKTFDLTVRVQQILPLLPEGTEVTVIVPTSDEVYSALVAGFSRAVVERIDT